MLQVAQIHVPFTVYSPGAPGVDRKVISGLCCVDRMKASVVRLWCALMV
jgi:hypothetical protein